MNKTDFIVSCAKLAGWKVEGEYIMAPNMFLFNFEELSSGFITQTKQKDWDLLYYESLLDKALSMINLSYANGSGNFEIVTHAYTIVIFDRAHLPVGVFPGKGKEIKEEVLHKYFELLEDGK